LLITKGAVAAVLAVCDRVETAAGVVPLDGRRAAIEAHVFANTLKYVFMATSANFGNMFSMAGASLFLPFLPLLPKQVLLTEVPVLLLIAAIVAAYVAAAEVFKRRFYAAARNGG
jgi:hypothetical protein